MKDYGISFIPDINQGLIKPNDPIASDKLDEKRVNELIDQRLEGLEGIKGEKGDKGDKGDKGEKGDKGDKGEDANSSLKELKIIGGKKLRVEFSTKQTSSAYPLKTLSLSRLGIKLAGDDEFLKINALEFIDNSNNNLLLSTIENETLNKTSKEHVTTLPADFSLENADTEGLNSYAKVKITSNGAYEFGNRYAPYYAFREYDSSGISVFLANNGLKDPFYTIEAELSKPIKEFKFTPWGYGVGGNFFSENLNIKIYIDDVLFKEFNSLNPNSKEIDTDFTISFNIQGDKLVYDAFKDEIDERFRIVENKLKGLGATFSLNTTTKTKTKKGVK